jgi:hypothetical protein
MVRSAVVSLVSALVFSVAMQAAPAEVVVVNTPAEVIPVSINEPEPFQAAANVTQLSGANAGVLTFPTVPAGKRLVIEYVTASGQVPPGQFVELLNVSTTSGNGAVTHNLLVFAQPPAGNGDTVARAAQQVKLYANDGTSVKVIFRRSSPAGVAFFGATISGYLVNE